MPTNCGIYQLVHKKTGLRYVGSSINLQTRKMSHFPKGKWKPPIKVLYLNNPRLSSLMKSFHFGVIEYYPNDYNPLKLRRHEKEWIRLVSPELSLNIHYYDRIRVSRKKKIMEWRKTEGYKKHPVT